MTIDEMIVRADRALKKEGDIAVNALDAQAWIARAALEVQREVLAATLRGSVAGVAGQIETVIRNAVGLNTMVVPVALSGHELVINCLAVGIDPTRAELQRIFRAWECLQAFRGAGWHVQFAFLGEGSDTRARRCSDASLPHVYRHSFENGPAMVFPFCVSCGYVPTGIIR